MTPYGFNREEAAAYVGVSPRTFDKMLSEGKMPVARVYGARKIWLRDELEACAKGLSKEGVSERDPWEEDAA